MALRRGGAWGRQAWQRQRAPLPQWRSLLRMSDKSWVGMVRGPPTPGHPASKGRGHCL